ncbi:MAG: ABC transporter permease [Clostridiales bacterium]|nr:ABC transporter permease [Clostridiales bacterium]MDD7387093.1 ABC transporter permease [Bacillota bacterium]MDY6041905.1 ABC transporter permease [Candidatus Faecousia sp.]
MNTAKYVLKRVLFMLLTFFIIISICFILIRLLPNETATMFGKDMQLVLQSRYRQGLTDINGNPIPLMQQYVNFVRNTLIGGNWGTSEKLYFGQDCFQIFLSKLPATVLVNLYSSLMAVPLGLMLGIYAALKKNKWQDHLISTGVMVMVSVPSYVYAFLVQYLLCFKLKLFPVVMEAGTNYFSWAMFKSMLPAVLSLSFSSIAGYARYTRAELTEVLTSEYLLLARTKGLTRAQTTVRHALRNAMVPIFPSIISEVIYVLSGSIIIENIFVVPGVGSLYINSITALDYNFFLLLSAFYTLIGLTAGIVVDISYGIIDPRIRMGSKK